MKILPTETELSRARPVHFAMNRRRMVTLLVGGLTVLIAPSARAADDSKKVTLYKDPQCGCCENYADYLRQNGFDVTVVGTHDLPLMNEQLGVPDALQGCHLSKVGGYVVEGHVPVDVLKRLLAEKPPITGITLPGMPLGAPGMNGKKIAPFTIYEIGKSARKVYATA